MNTILSILLTLGINVSSSFGIVQNDDVNLRSEPQAASNVISTLNRNDRLQILSTENRYSVVKGYVGKWCKVKFNERIGYVLSCFIDSEQLNDEKFQAFNDRLLSSIRTKILDPTLIGEVVEYSHFNCGDSQPEKKKIKKDEFALDKLEFIVSEEAIIKKISINESFDIEMYFSIDGGYNTVYIVRLIDGKWKIVGIRVVNC